MLFKVNPVSLVCVRVASEPAPKTRTAESDNNLRSLPIIASLATLKPPSVCNDPSVVLVASVVSSVIIIPLAVMAAVVVAPAVGVAAAGAGTTVVLVGRPMNWAP